MDAPEPAGWWRRAAATLLDGLIVSLPVAALVGLLAGTWSTAGDKLAGFALVWLFLSPLLAGIYAPLLMVRRGRRNGQTLGKQALGIRVRTQGGEPVRFGTAILRELAAKALLGFVPFYTFVDSLFPLWDARRQAVHDKLASTRVWRA